jgi:hypothetical protein
LVLDSAIGAQLTNRIPECGITPTGGGSPLPQYITAQPVSPAIGMRVWKRGATTGVTAGTIVDIDLAPSVGPAGHSYWSATNVDVRSDDPDHPFTRGGDSGAVVCDYTGAPVLLHVAGNSTISIGIPIEDAMTFLGVTQLTI